MRISAGWGCDRSQKSKRNGCIRRKTQGTLSFRAVYFVDFFELEGGVMPFCDFIALLHLTVCRGRINSSIWGFCGIYVWRLNKLWEYGRKLLLKYWVYGQNETILSNRAVNDVKVWVKGRSLLGKILFCILSVPVLFRKHFAAFIAGRMRSIHDRRDCICIKYWVSGRWRVYGLSSRAGRFANEKDRWSFLRRKEGLNSCVLLRKRAVGMEDILSSGAVTVEKTLSLRAVVFSFGSH